MNVDHRSGLSDDELLGCVTADLAELDRRKHRANGHPATLAGALAALLDVAVTMGDPDVCAVVRDAARRLEEG